MGKLSVLKVKHAKPGRHGDGDGLYLLVSDTGAKSWMLRVMAMGYKKDDPQKLKLVKMRRDVGLGPLSQYSLEKARERAREIRNLARTGVDPTKERDKEKEAPPPSFRSAALLYHEAKAPGWGGKHGAAFLSTLALHIFPKIGDLRVDEVTERDIAAALSDVWLSKPSAARKLRQRIGLVLDYSNAMGWRKMPVDRRGLSTLLAKQQEAGNFASMPYEEVPAFVSKQETAEETMGRLALLFTIYTAARNGEVREAKWSHVDREAKLWNRPAELMRKTGDAHSVTLSPQALALLDRAAELRTVERDCLIFPGKGGKRLSDATLAKYVRPLGYTVHGFRSSFRTWAAEKMPSVPEAVAEAALAHTIPDKVVRAYQRAKFMEMRSTLLDAWGRYASGHSGEVIQLPLGLHG